MKPILALTLLATTLTFSVWAEALPVIQVNGLADLFGSKVVLFKLNGDEKNLMLVEGQGRNGLRLVKVDLAAGTARFENGGQFQTIRIAAAPAQSVAASPAADWRRITPETTRDRLAYDFKPVMTEAGALPNLDGTGAGFAGGAATSRRGNSPALGKSPAGTSAEAGSAGAGTGSVNDGGAGTGASNPENNWNTSWQYRQSLEIEAARSRDAAAILAGQELPYPLTPLTPPGTPAQLVSSAQIDFPPPKRLQF